MTDVERLSRVYFCPGCHAETDYIGLCPECKNPKTPESASDKFGWRDVLGWIVIVLLAPLAVWPLLIYLYDCFQLWNSPPWP